MRAYVDSSVALGWLLAEPGRPASFTVPLVSSELLSVEVFRVLDRLRILHQLTDEDVATKATEARRFLSGCEIVEITTEILRRAAGPFPTMIATLDAIHLATALLWSQRQEEKLKFLTLDRQLAAAAIALGFEVRPR